MIKNSIIRIESMQPEHLESVLHIERSCFAIPWSRESFMRELMDNVIAIYAVAKAMRDGDWHIAGYAGMWHVVTEGHITNIAVCPTFRRVGVADTLLSHLISVARQKGMIGVTLEVRMGNEGAMKLYNKHGFKPEGIRKNYYAETKEDAVIMWKYLD